MLDINQDYRRLPYGDRLSLLRPICKVHVTPDYLIKLGQQNDLSSAQRAYEQHCFAYAPDIKWLLLKGEMSVHFSVFQHHKNIFRFKDIDMSVSVEMFADIHFQSRGQQGWAYLTSDLSIWLSALLGPIADMYEIANDPRTHNRPKIDDYIANICYLLQFWEGDDLFKSYGNKVPTNK